jgi:hypothetical protein
MAAEKNFENRIKKFLNDEGCWNVKFFANAYTKSGIPDILCCCNGYFVAVEVKAPKGKPSELQKMNIRKINEENGFAVILYPDQFDYFKELIHHLNGKNEYLATLTLLKINERWLK